MPDFLFLFSRTCQEGKKCSCREIARTVVVEEEQTTKNRMYIFHSDMSQIAA